MCLAIARHSGFKLGGGGRRRRRRDEERDRGGSEGVKEVAACLLTYLLYLSYLLGRLSCLVTRTKIHRFALLSAVLFSFFFLPLLCLAMPCRPYRGGKEEG